MTNSALLEMAARDRDQMRRGGCAARTSAPARRRPRPAGPQRAVGWFLVSVGLRLVLPPARAGSVR